ncbi:hypothetical protein GQ457_01G011880 [Hibiscus cannabinus]
MDKVDNINSTTNTTNTFVRSTSSFKKSTIEEIKDGSTQVGQEMSTPKDSNPIEPSTEEPSSGIKRGRKSDVWNHFKRQKIGDKWKAVCLYCQKKLGGESRDGTTHLRNHFKICPLRKAKDIKQSFLGVKIESKEKTLVNWEYDTKLLRKEIVCMIAFHEYPLTMVEHYWFRRVMKIACPMFKEYTRNTAKNDIFKVYENEKKKMINTLQNNDSKIAITTDMWTSTHQKKGFMEKLYHGMVPPRVHRTIQ